MKPRIEDMTDDLRARYELFAMRMINMNIKFRVCCVIRTQAEQDAFYAQGREGLSDVNARRMTAGMRPITEKQNVIVTHTKNSLHFPDKNGKARAFDIEIVKGDDIDAEPTWDLKYDGQGDGLPDYLQAAGIGRSCGLECGAFWEKFHDYPHYQSPIVS